MYLINRIKNLSFRYYLAIKNIEKLRKIIKKEHRVIKVFILFKIIKFKSDLNHFIANE